MLTPAHQTAMCVDVPVVVVGIDTCRICRPLAGSSGIQKRLADELNAIVFHSLISDGPPRFSRWTLELEPSLALNDPCGFRA